MDIKVFLDDTWVQIIYNLPNFELQLLGDILMNDEQIEKLAIAVTNALSGSETEQKKEGCWQ